MTTILIKKKDTAGVPGTSDLTNAAGGTEIAVNTFTKRVYTKNGANQIVELGTFPSSLTTTNADITNLSVTSLTLTNPVSLANISGSNLSYTSGTITTLTSSSAAITTLSGSSAVITNISDGSGKVRAIPSVGSAVTTSYTLSVTDVGKYVSVGASGSIVVPNDIFTSGDAVTVYNDTTGNVTINCPITTAYLNGTNTDRASLTLSTRGLATVLFINPSLCVMSGALV